MIRSWIGWLLPEDEYKRQKVLYFIAEGAFLSCSIFFAVGIFLILFNASDDTWLATSFLSSMIFPVYVTIRYTLSGIEYANVEDEKDKKTKKKTLLKSTIGFFLIFLLFNILTKPLGDDSWLDVIMVPILVSLFWYIIGYVSLTRSIRKNKQLDE
ncbi:hypothetical protein NSQ26_09260 [Bacillus sp. FSL W7-1360]